MSNLVRRDPYALDDLFDDLFKGFFVRPVRMPADMPDMQSIRMDVKEGDQAYTVHAEMPGVAKDDIHITLDGRTLVLSAEVKKDTEEKDGDKLLRSERHFGKVSRTIGLSQEVDEANAKARFDNGVLELVLPKKAIASARRLAIE
ncbi:MAG: Hsp20/alpha crystallin family protein [Betaproteobacteria bacterium]|nr:Hsp20/alpha crystallin family protein [Betaproteobacteria bacterium]